MKQLESVVGDVEVLWKDTLKEHLEVLRELTKEEGDKARIPMRALRPPCSKPSGHQSGRRVADGAPSERDRSLSTSVRWKRILPEVPFCPSYSVQLFFSVIFY